MFDKDFVIILLLLLLLLLSLSPSPPLASKNKKTNTSKRTVASHKQPNTDAQCKWIVRNSAVHLLPAVNCACLLDSLLSVDLYCFAVPWQFWSINCAASAPVFCLINNSAVSESMDLVGRGRREARSNFDYSSILFPSIDVGWLAVFFLLLTHTLSLSPLRRTRSCSCISFIANWCSIVP